MNVSFTQTVAFFYSSLWDAVNLVHIFSSAFLLTCCGYFFYSCKHIVYTHVKEWKNDMDKYYSQVKLLHNQIFFQKWFSWSTVLFFSRSSGIRGTGNLVALKSKHADKWDINISLLSPYKYWMPTLLQAVVTSIRYWVLGLVIRQVCVNVCKCYAVLFSCMDLMYSQSQSQARPNSKIFHWDSQDNY